VLEKTRLFKEDKLENPHKRPGENNLRLGRTWTLGTKSGKGGLYARKNSKCKEKKIWLGLDERKAEAEGSDDSDSMPMAEQNFSSDEETEVIINEKGEIVGERLRTDLPR
jgi:hypothetical protein